MSNAVTYERGLESVAEIRNRVSEEKLAVIAPIILSDFFLGIDLESLAFIPLIQWLLNKDTGYKTFGELVSQLHKVQANYDAAPDVEDEPALDIVLEIIHQTIAILDAIDLFNAL